MYFNDIKNLLQHLGLIKQINNQDYLEKIAILFFGTKDLILKYFPFFQCTIIIEDSNFSLKRQEFNIIDNIFNVINEFNKIYKMLALNPDDFKNSPELPDRLKQHHKIFENCIFSMFYNYDFFQYRHSKITFTNNSIHFDFPLLNKSQMHSIYIAPKNCFKNILLKINTFQQYDDILSLDTTDNENQRNTILYENLVYINNNYLVLQRPNYFYIKLQNKANLNSIIRSHLINCIKTFLISSINHDSVLNLNIFNLFPELINSYMKFSDNSQNDVNTQIKILLALKKLQNNCLLSSLHQNDAIFLNDVIYNLKSPLYLKKSTLPRKTRTLIPKSQENTKLTTVKNSSIIAPNLSIKNSIKIPLKLRNKIKKLSKREVNYENVTSIILDLCHLQPMTIPEIAYYIKRNPRYISTYISKLRVQNKLLLFYPNIKNHPQQKYISNNPII